MFTERNIKAAFKLLCEMYDEEDRWMMDASDDFFALEDGKYGKGIINNCKTKIILNLEDDEAERVKDIFKLSEAEIMEITHFERGNGLISTNNNNITVEFKCSELEKSLITTDRRELQQILEHKKENGNF
mgnify:CR=1 FL=1